MDLHLADRTVIVTGASSGVGLATARMLLDAGSRVALCARDLGRLDAVVDDLGVDRDRVLTAACDVLDAESVNAFVTATIDRFGAIDGLVCNAGRSLMAPLFETTDEQIREELELKLFGVLHIVRAARGALAASDAGSVVVVNAILSRQPEARLAVTSAARAGLLNLATTLSHDLAADGTRVNSVLLGLVDTGQWQRRYEQSGSDTDFATWSAEIAADRGISLGRFGTADEVAFPITCFLSPRNGYVTGATLDVGGGVARYV